MTTTARPLTELVDQGWAQALAPVSDQIAQMGQFLRAEIAAGRRYLPAGPNVLRAFSFPFEQVRVLIVGQDPYPTPGHAVGLSFSVAPDVRPLPRSLVNIFTEYSADLGYPAPSNGDLTPWSQRGVMLLNRVLTVRPGTPASHRGKGWEAVTECAIRALVARDEPLVAILWGRDASTLKPMLALPGGQERSDSGMKPSGQERSDSGMKPSGQERSDSGMKPSGQERSGSRCVSIESPHPSPLSASRGFFGSRPFSRANELLTGMGAAPIDWRLP